MKNFVVSARKYRPAVFGHVLGQPHITITLKNAIREQHLAQAFLFCGPRGVGKTTCARILAKAINCEQMTEAAEPCNTCTSCTSFNNSSSMNVYELDAASNNSVEDIRTLVEQVRYPPQAGKYKTYIIDEVHMLSSSAFNAFLKTLEEPPSYAIFILATTEKHKIIPTILSRCQIFDFHRIQPQAIVQQLQHIAQEEDVAYEEGALHLISQKADGALRDALSIFDLITTFAAGQKLTYKAALEHLHILDYAYYFKLVDACLQGDIGGLLLLYDEILKAGFDGHHFITGLSEHLRNLMVCQDESTLALLEVAESVRDQYQAQSAATGTSFLLQALHIVTQCDLHYKGSNNKRLHVELALIDLTQIQGAAAAPSLPKSSKATKASSKLQAEAASTTPKTPKTQKEEAITPAKEAPTKQQTAASATLKTLKTQELPLGPSQKETPTPSAPPPGRKTSARLQPPPTAAPTTTLQATVKLPPMDQLIARVNQQETAEASATALPAAQPLTEVAVRQHWQAYAQKLREAGNMTAYSVLGQGMTLEDSTIVVQLVNSVQQDILDDLKEDLMATLRRALQNPGLELRAVVAAIDQQPKKPYTTQEKFAYLAEKYPTVRLLQKKLALEVQD